MSRRNLPMPMWLLAESFVRQMAEYTRRSPSKYEVSEDDIVAEIGNFVAATDLPVLQRLQSAELLKLAFDLLVEGRSDWHRAAHYAFPCDASASIAVHLPKVAQAFLPNATAAAPKRVRLRRSRAA